MLILLLICCIGYIGFKEEDSTIISDVDNNTIYLDEKNTPEKTTDDNLQLDVKWPIKTIQDNRENLFVKEYENKYINDKTLNIDDNEIENNNRYTKGNIIRRILYGKAYNNSEINCEDKIEQIIELDNTSTTMNTSTINTEEFYIQGPTSVFWRIF